MKRNQVMDLYHGHRAEEIGDWQDIEKGLPKHDGKGNKVKVKLSNGDEFFAYFYPDINFCKFHFWHSVFHEPIKNVKHFKYLKE